MNDLISREEAKKALGDIHPLDYNAQAYKAKIESIPSADIMECARAIKEYCKKRECERCDFADHSISRGTLCGLYYACPCGWDLPEGERGGAE